jgi:heme/copper-type cytochrome/quinol oxidase subunit 3
MSTRSRSIDVSELPTFAFGHQGLIWWGSLGFMVIEGSMFLIVFVVYFYLRLKVEQWPPSLPDPDYFYGTVNTVVLLASLVPNHFAKAAAERLDLSGVRLWIVVMTVLGMLPLGIRFLEYFSLNCRWDSNAYGSIVWLLISLHTMHLATDAVDSLVLGTLMFTDKVEGKRFVDVSENAMYWNFIVLSWIPVYLLIYFGPRLMR